MDALSDLLQVVKLNGALFLDSRFTAPWCVESRPGRESGGIFAGLEHIVFFHALTHGRCRVRLKSGGETLQVQAGDLLLLAHDDAHYLGTDLQLAAVTSDTLVRPAPPGGLHRRRSSCPTGSSSRRRTLASCLTRSAVSTSTWCTRIR
jgi:hypothetical protein